MRAEFLLLASGELLLVLIAGLWLWWSGKPLSWSWDLRSGVWIVCATLGLIVVNGSLYFLLRRKAAMHSVFALFDAEIFPFVRSLRPFHLLVLAALAGVGEELLFRGVLQAEIGILASSILFGIAHGPTRALWPMALWAGVMGLLFAVMYRLSGNLLVPIFVHAGYDAAAFFYIWSTKSGPNVMSATTQVGEA